MSTDNEYRLSELRTINLVRRLTLAEETELLRLSRRAERIKLIARLRELGGDDSCEPFGHRLARLVESEIAYWLQQGGRPEPNEVLARLLGAYRNHSTTKTEARDGN